jgi:predicted XRE-type DNA-binding protein
MGRRRDQRHFIISLDNSQFEGLLKITKDLIKVLAAMQIKEDKGTEYNARFLKVFNLTDQEIANLLGVDRSTVTKAISKSKQKNQVSK